MFNSVSYTQIKNSFEEASRELSVWAGSDPEELHWQRGWFEAEDGSEIFVEISVFNFDMNVQLGPVLNVDGDLERDIVTLDDLEQASRMLYQGLTYRGNIVF